MRGFFTFPNPVNETSARFVAASVALLAIVTVAFQQGWLLPVLAYGFVARVVAGPRLSPLAFFATRVFTPRLRIVHRYSPGPAKRFAQTIGAAFTVSATLLWYVAGMHVEALALVGVLAAFASLEAAAGVCVGCRAFYLGMRFGLVPPHVCEDCAKVLVPAR
jgi:hypothetical protein